MEQRFILKMGKRNDKGYALSSVVIVLMILSVCSLWGTLTFSKSYERYALNSAIEMCRFILLQAKYDAYFNDSHLDVCFLKDKITYGEEEKGYPRGISNSSTVCFRYNQNGNISKAGTIHLQGRNMYKEFVVELGGGLFEVREIEDL